MKILKIFGVVVGIHVFVIIGAFVIPGCSSASKSTPKPEETAALGPSSAATSAPTAPPEMASPLSPAPMTFGPEPAISPGSNAGGTRFPPTRPGSAAAPLLAPAPVTNVTPAVTYTVKPGDSFWVIARRNNLTVAELAAANNLKTSAVLQAGQRLIIPGKPVPIEPPQTSAKNGAAKASPVAAAGPAPANVFKHTVKYGESLSTIAKQYGVTVRELGTVNHIADPQKLAAGAELIIPGWQPGGKSGSRQAEPPSLLLPPPVELNPLLTPASPEPSPLSPAGDVPVIRVAEPPPSASKGI